MIETERLRLRSWLESDKAEFIAMNQDPRVMEYFPHLMPAAETETMLERIEQHMAEHGFGLWAAEIKATGEFIGFIGLSIPRFQADFTPCVEVGWRLRPGYWGKGYAQEGARACFDYGFSRLGLERILSFTSVFNVRSINVMEKTGMTYVKEFAHPVLEPDHWLSRHVLYEKKRG